MDEVCYEKSSKKGYKEPITFLEDRKWGGGGESLFRENEITFCCSCCCCRCRRGGEDRVSDQIGSRGSSARATGVRLPCGFHL
ncbi:hypothetical protein Nepgr_022354 [Nepenthes gracilis]|uniref:Uncharacterized protein n=1 Tax=Nepenthes gracilis TaxID=150966 RepID=A0AAD3T039_NEPGR|nr:hypothetical protein Nepgr_022354 [Nepenthes gracilis]